MSLPAQHGREASVVRRLSWTRIAGLSALGFLLALPLITLFAVLPARRERLRLPGCLLASYYIPPASWTPRGGFNTYESGYWWEGETSEGFYRRDPWTLRIGNWVLDVEALTPSDPLPPS